MLKIGYLNIKMHKKMCILPFVCFCHPLVETGLSIFCCYQGTKREQCEWTRTIKESGGAYQLFMAVLMMFAPCQPSICANKAAILFFGSMAALFAHMLRGKALYFIHKRFRKRVNAPKLHLPNVYLFQGIVQLFRLSKLGNCTV